MVESSEEYKMTREGIKITNDKDGNKIINDFLTIQHESGKGAYCKVRKGLGIYPPDDECPEGEEIPYAIK